MKNKMEKLSSDKLDIIINGKKVAVNRGETILKAAGESGIFIPALCYHEEVKPCGACRLCLVEIEVEGKTKIVASCGYHVEKAMVVRTESPGVEQIRKNLVELYMALFPFNPVIKDLARKYGISKTRYKKEYNYCILCGLCVRYCAEVKKNHAIGFVGRGIDKKVAFIPDSSYFKYCQDCMECARICPTGVFPSNYGIDRIPQLDNL
jgi:bidirectional [NiFe] hydrogenase diaphorase subunit